MLFALFVSPQLRGLNRISVYIAFFSLATVAAYLDRWCVRPGRSRAVRAAGWIALVLLLALGLLDQTPGRFDVAAYQQTAQEYYADKGFFGQVQGSVPRGTMIFQLPYVAFPESVPPTEAMCSDSHFRGYILTRGLRWSYGTVKDGQTDYWQQRVTALALPQTVRTLALAGFGGIFLERTGYDDHGAAADKTLRELLGPPVAERPAREFFSMANYDRDLRASMSDAQWQAASESVLHMVFVRFGAGFTGPEFKDGHNWYWCGPEGEMTLTNGGDSVRHVRMTMSAQTGRSDPARLTMSGVGSPLTWTIGPALQLLTVTFDLPPGDFEVRFTCDGLPIEAPGDARVMVWSPVDFQIENVDSATALAVPDAPGQPQ